MANITNTRLLNQIKKSYAEVYELELEKKKLSRTLRAKKKALTSLLDFLREK